MKYIRTADGRIMKHPHPDEEVFTFRYEIIKSADSIIELCDYIFLFDNEVTIRKITHEDDENAIEYLKECIELGMKIKLAVLTDKGLIYVAKMNAKGKLELI